MSTQITQTHRTLVDAARSSGGVFAGRSVDALRVQNLSPALRPSPATLDRVGRVHLDHLVARFGGAVVSYDAGRWFVDVRRF